MCHDVTTVNSSICRDESNPEAKDSNPNHFILLESESESTQVCKGFESDFANPL